jgi:glycerol-3-phosphate O-acyltransferase 3/4
MTSWCLVADIYFLPPQQQLDGESSTEFAQRVQKMIADKVKLRIVPWDGYLKYYNLAEKV